MHRLWLLCILCLVPTCAALPLDECEINQLPKDLQQAYLICTNKWRDLRDAHEHLDAWASLSKPEAPSHWSILVANLQKLLSSALDALVVDARSGQAPVVTLTMRALEAFLSSVNDPKESEPEVQGQDLMREAQHNMLLGHLAAIKYIFIRLQEAFKPGLAFQGPNLAFFARGLRAALDLNLALQPLTGGSSFLKASLQRVAYDSASDEEMLSKLLKQMLNDVQRAKDEVGAHLDACHQSLQGLLRDDRLFASLWSALDDAPKVHSRPVVEFFTQASCQILFGEDILACGGALVEGIDQITLKVSKGLESMWELELSRSLGASRLARPFRLQELHLVGSSEDASAGQGEFRFPLLDKIQGLQEVDPIYAELPTDLYQALDSLNAATKRVVCSQASLLKEDSLVTRRMAALKDCDPSTLLMEIYSVLKATVAIYQTAIDAAGTKSTNRLKTHLHALLEPAACEAMRLLRLLIGATMPG